MAQVAPQSTEELPDKIVYKYPATRFEQVATIYSDTSSPGLKTLINQDSGGSTSLIVPPSANKAKYYTIDVFFKTGVILKNTLLGATYFFIENDFFRIEFPAVGLLQFDGRPTQSKFYNKENNNNLQ